MTEKEARRLLEWFAGYVGDVIKPGHYERLMVQLANMTLPHLAPFAEIGAIIDWMYPEGAE